MIDCKKCVWKETCNAHRVVGCPDGKVTKTLAKIFEDFGLPTLKELEEQKAQLQAKQALQEMYGEGPRFVDHYGPC